VLIGGEPGYFYFDKTIIQEIAAVEGVKQASPQCYFTSITAECCDSPGQLIGFDPATDFVVQPWIAETYGKKITDGELVAGSEIRINPNNKLRFYADEYPVAAQLGKTATGVDVSVFMNMATMRTMRDRAHEAGFRFIADEEPAEAISAVLVRIDQGVDAASIGRMIKKSHPQVDVILSQGILTSIAGTLRSLVGYIRVFSFALWIITFLVLAAVFTGGIHERKKEFAILRLLGATRKKVTRLVLYESALAALAGGLAGISAAALTVFPFSVFIGGRLELPYIQPGPAVIAGIFFFSLFFSVAAGPLASVYSALKISGAETYFTMREGE
jgi:putative ABC transport system permease protein